MAPSKMMILAALVAGASAFAPAPAFTRTSSTSLFMAEDTDERVKKVVSEQLGVDVGELEASKSFIDDLGADSLDAVEIIMALEEEFDIEIPEEEAEKIANVGDAIAYADKA